MLITSTSALALKSALESYYLKQEAGVKAAVGIRQDLGFKATLLGYDGPSALTLYDSASQARIDARALTVASRLRSVPGAYEWRRDGDILSIAADALRFYVLGDMAGKAVRTDPAYREDARAYYEQAENALQAAESAMADALQTDPNQTGAVTVEGPRSHSRRMVPVL